MRGAETGPNAKVRRRPVRNGFVLPVVLLCLLALASVAAASLELARREQLADRAATAAFQARVAAESGIRAGAAALGSPELDRLRRSDFLALPPLSLAPRVRVRSRVYRVRPEWLWMESTGTDLRAGLRTHGRLGVLRWSLEPGARTAELQAAAVHGSELVVEEGGELRGSGSVGAPDDWPPTVCAPLFPVLDSLRPAGMPAAFGWTPPEPGEPGPLSAVPRLGLLDGPALWDRATVRVRAPEMTPGPTEVAGACLVSDPANWGSPSRPEGVCGGRFPLVVVDGSLRMVGGEGQGILVVGGDLTLDAEARFVGLVLAAGYVRIEAGSLLQGAVRARRGIVVAGHVEASPCGVLSALRARPELSRPVPVPGGGWIRLP